MQNKMSAVVLAASAMMMSLGVQARDITEIRWGTDPGNAPFEFKNADGKLAGFDIDLGQAICAHLKARCTWVENDFDGMIPALKAKKLDGLTPASWIRSRRAAAS